MGGGGLGLGSPELRRAETKYGSVKAVQQNTHATVKPLKLMSYLISIGSRPGDVILDPFVGSGTTAVAAAILDRRYIGIELDAEMCDIAERRIKWHTGEADKPEKAESGQASLFDL